MTAIVDLRELVMTMPQDDYYALLAEIRRNMAYPAREFLIDFFDAVRQA